MAVKCETKGYKKTKDSTRNANILEALKVDPNEK
jgi:hypothetical protein